MVFTVYKAVSVSITLIKKIECIIKTENVFLLYSNLKVTNKLYWRAYKNVIYLTIKFTDLAFPIDSGRLRKPVWKAKPETVAGTLYVTMLPNFRLTNPALVLTAQGSFRVHLNIPATQQ